MPKIATHLTVYIVWIIVNCVKSYANLFPICINASGSKESWNVRFSIFSEYSIKFLKYFSFTSNILIFSEFPNKNENLRPPILVNVHLQAHETWRLKLFLRQTLAFSSTASFFISIFSFEWNENGLESHINFLSKRDDYTNAAQSNITSSHSITGRSFHLIRPIRCWRIPIHIHRMKFELLIRSICNAPEQRQPQI